MKTIFALAVIGILLFGCAQQQPSYECNKLYMKVGSECCLDKDGNKVCDKDEQKQPSAPQQPAQAPEPAKENKTNETVSGLEANASVPGNAWCSYSFKGAPEFIPAGECSAAYDEETLVRAWCNPADMTLQENCEICGCAEQLPCIMGKCERPQPEAPAGAIRESDSRNLGGLDVKLVKVYTDHTADVEISYETGGIKQSEIATLGYGRNIARKVANTWYANLSLASSGFMPTGIEYPVKAKSWAVIEMEGYTTECMPLYVADVLHITYLDDNGHTQKFDVAPSQSEQYGWRVVIRDYRYFDLREDKALTMDLNNSSVELAQSGIMLAECGSDNKQISVSIASGRLFDYSK